MFQLENQTAKLSNVNLRAELHGEETKVAVDLKFDMKLSNDVLSYFDPSLKSSLSFRAIAHPSSDEDQLKQDLAGMDEDEE